MMMVTAIEFETTKGTKLVSLGEIVLFLLDQLPKEKREKFLEEVSPFRLVEGRSPKTGSPQ